MIHHHPTASTRAQAAINADTQANLNRDADQFELTERQFDNLAALPSAECAHQLQQLINAYDFDRRPIIGVYGALTYAGMGRWQDAWLAELDSHMARAWGAFERAERRFVGEAA